MSDPGRSGREGTGWHRHGYQSGPLVIRAEYCHEDMPPGVPCTPVLVLDPVTARDTIARALGNLNVDGWVVVPDRNTGEPMQEQVPLDYITDAVLAALASQALQPSRPTQPEESTMSDTATQVQPTCPIDGPRPVAAGLPDHPGYSGWGKVQALDGRWIACLRCGDCGRVLLVAPAASQERGDG